ncbi:MAG: MlaE family ABC transporter permease, partial [Fibrobacterota bacterium]
MRTDSKIFKTPEKFDRAYLVSSGLSRIEPGKIIKIDMSLTKSADSVGTAFLIWILEQKHSGEINAEILELPGDVESEFKKLLERKKTEHTHNKTGVYFFYKIGSLTENLFKEIRSGLSMVTEVLYWGTGGLLKRKDFKKGSITEQAYFLGFSAMGIVCLLSFLVGLVLAIQSAIQLSRYGADIFLAPVIGVSMIRELGPLITAVILAGRNGSATTAEIATMQVQEEIDALRIMALNPIQFIVVPKFWASTITMPVLSVMATVSGIFAGALVSVFYLQGTLVQFWGELIKEVYLYDIIFSLAKSIVFSWLIIWIGAYWGFRTRGGAEDVGKNTTLSVVTGIFCIIVADALFSFFM